MILLGVVGVVGVVGVLVLSRSRLKRGMRLTPPSPLAAIAAFLVAVGLYPVFNALVDPEPLPEPDLALQRGDSASGGLIAFTDGMWYLDSGDDRFTAVPASEVLEFEDRNL